ncbi:inositol phospholipid synthesis and fat-storage-inducing TM domain-containing protein [Ditylenchus destructor]|uniref:Inositol phospholipid synthesis and fat-storage-inducing TM domain-containing protein n=1 Tax=Ditylenchus destructor TaxID=166010 RepID=A0AAD4N2N3_9BILA|nr:inositol phospholipid synthesis and fat-storage-inducing TM domain-containing protein [Ditylenchus destructor]
MANRHQVKNDSNQNESSPRRNSTQSLTGIDVALGMSTQVARKFLFVDVRRRAMFYLAVITILSMFAEYFPPVQNYYYFTQKHNLLNTYGTKIGWFWTTALLCPFIWLTSLLHHGSRAKALKDLTRVAIATFFWYTATSFFVHIERQTGKCHGALHAGRHNCSDEGGKWIPGFDISGHAFLLVYSALIICEEITSFRNWPNSPRTSPSHIPNRYEYENFKQSTKIIQYLFIALSILVLLWDFQMIITSLYYHAVIHKFLGVGTALLCWAFTYRVLFPIASFLPIRRHIKSF